MNARSGRLFRNIGVVQMVRSLSLVVVIGMSVAGLIGCGGGGGSGLSDYSSMTLMGTITGHTDNVSSVAFSPDGKTVVSGSWDDTIKLWDSQTGALKRTLTGHRNLVISVAFSPDGKTLASGSFDDTVKLWRIP